MRNLSHLLKFAVLTVLPFAVICAAAAQTQVPPPVAGGVMTIALSTSQLDFGSESVGSTSPLRSTIVTVSASSDLPVKVSGIPAGDFEVTSKPCDLKGSGSCAISVTFTPKQPGETTSSVTVIASSSTVTLTKLVALTGKGEARCTGGRSIFTREGFSSLSSVLIVVLLYLAGIILVRWNLVARPTRSLLRAYIQAVRCRVATLTAAPPASAAQVTALLAQAEEFIRDKGPLAMLPDYFLWNRGQELAGWSCVHEAEELATSFLPEDTVRAELERAELELRQSSAPTAAGLADKVRDALTAPPDPLTAPPATGRLHRWRAVLDEALGLLYDQNDTKFASLISWHNKTVWLVGAGLLFIVSLAASMQHEVLFLLGATGGLLSRLSRSLQRKDVPTDYGASWTTLFLSPVVGALAGWSGVLLLSAASDRDIVGPAIKIDWCNPSGPLALGAALLLGTSERAFNKILGQLEEKLIPPQPAAPQPASPPLNIITSGTLSEGKVGQPYDQPLVASGGTSPYRWALTKDALPAGLQLNTSGRINGTPTTPTGKDGTTFTLQVTDAASKTKSQEFSIVVV